MSGMARVYTYFLCQGTIEDLKVQGGKGQSSRHVSVFKFSFGAVRAVHSVKSCELHFFGGESGHQALGLLRLTSERGQLQASAVGGGTQGQPCPVACNAGMGASIPCMGICRTKSNDGCAAGLTLKASALKMLGLSRCSTNPCNHGTNVCACADIFACVDYLLGYLIDAPTHRDNDGSCHTAHASRRQSNQGSLEAA